MTFCRRWASFKLSKWLQGSGFSLFFFHGLEGPGFRIFTGVSKGHGSDFSLVFSGFSLVVQLFHRRGGSRVQAFHCFFFHGLEGPGFRFFTGVGGPGFFFSRARGARVQDFHWRLEGPGFRFFTGFLCFPPMVQFLRRLGGSGVQVFVFFFHGLEGPGFRIFTVFFFSRARGARVRVFHWRRGARVRFFTGLGNLVRT